MLLHRMVYLGLKKVRYGRRNKIANGRAQESSEIEVPSDTDDILSMWTT